MSSPARAAELAAGTQYRYDEAGLPVAARRGETAVRVVWDDTGRLPLEVTWNDGRQRVFEYDAQGRRVATRDGEGRLISRVEYAQKPGFPLRIRETTRELTRTIFLDDELRATKIIDTYADERQSVYIDYHDNGLVERFEYRVERLDTHRFHFDGGQTEDGVIVEVDYDAQDSATSADQSECSTYSPDELGKLTHTLTSVRGPRARVTTWLLTGGNKWRASDEEIAWAAQDMSRIDKWYNTAAGYGALIGVVSIFENMYLLGYDMGRVAFYDDTENNTYADLHIALRDHGPKILIDGFLELGHRAFVEGDPTAFGQFAFILAGMAESGTNVRLSEATMNAGQPTLAVLSNGETVLVTAPGAIAIPAVEGSGQLAANSGVSLMASQGDGGTGAEPAEKSHAARTEPRNLQEKLALKEAKAGAGERIMKGKINDPRFPEDTWAKMQHVHATEDGNIVIHYWENLENGQRIGFKFKD